MADFTSGLEMFLWRAAILLTFFWGAYACLGPQPRTRVLLCRVASIMLAALPLLSLLAVPKMINVPSLAESRWPVEKTLVPERADVPVNSPVPRQAGTISSRQTLSRPTWTLSEILVLFWMTGAGLLLTRWLIGCIIAQKLVKSSQAAPSEVQKCAAKLSSQLGLRRSVSVSLLDEAGSPLLIGPRLVILIPKHLLDTPEDLVSALAHELVHAKGRDWFWSQWLHIVIALVWPVPLAWFLRRAHDAASELVCDHEAASLSGGAKSYASALARQSLRTLGSLQLATMPMLRQSDIRHRIDLLLSGAVLPPLSHRSMTALGLTAFMLSTLLAGIQLAHSEDKPPLHDKAWTDYNYSAAERQSILGKLYDYFQSISSVSYTGTEVTLLKPDRKKLVKKITFTSSGDQYSAILETTKLTSTGEIIKPATDQEAANAREIVAFNGSEFQDLTYDLTHGTLWLRKGPPFYPTVPSLLHVAASSFLMLPFDFVGRTLTEDPGHPVALIPNLYKRSENWVWKVKGFQNGVIDDKSGIIMTVVGKDFDGDDTSIQVLLDPSRNYYPVAWKMPDARQPTMVLTYNIIEVGALPLPNASLPYPKAATLTLAENGKQIWMRTITIEQVSLNDIPSGDPRFTIDPKTAQVDFIVDGNTKTAVVK